MGKLIYSMNVSLDGYVEAPGHDLGWVRIDEELHAWFNELERATDVSLYGRGMYETMAAYWPTAGSDPAATPAELDFARIWAATPRIVFSSSLERVDWNSRLAQGGVAEELRRARAEHEGDLSVGGATLAASFIELGLVDEYVLAIHPVAIGAGTPYFPRLAAPIDLDLVETRQFASGVVALRHAARRA